MELSGSDQQLQKVEKKGWGLANISGLNLKALPVRIITGGVAILGLAFSVTILWKAFVAISILLAAGVTLGVGFVLMMLIPYLGQLIENRILSARKSEARRNPIEEMQRKVIDDAVELEEFRKKVEHFSNFVAGFEKKLEKRAKEDPGHDLTSMKGQLQDMKGFHDSLVEEYESTLTKHQAFETSVDRASFELESAQEVISAKEGLKPIDRESKTREILQAEAFKSVQSTYDQAFSRLRVKSGTLARFNEAGYDSTREQNKKE